MRLAAVALLAAIANPLSLIPRPESRIAHPESLIPNAARVGYAGRETREVIDRILAVVSGEPITLSDVTAALQFRLIVPPADAPDPQGYAVDRLIDRTLMLAEVERFQPPEPDPTEMTRRIDEIERRAGSAAAFEKALAVTGRTRDQLGRYIRDDLRTSTYLNQRFGADEGAEREAAIRTWTSELRKRADVTVLRK